MLAGGHMNGFKQLFSTTPPLRVIPRAGFARGTRFFSASRNLLRHSADAKNGADAQNDHRESLDRSPFNAA
jgi:hypothetical protein